MRSNVCLAFLVASAAALSGCGGGSVFGEAPAEVPPVDPTQPARIDLFATSPTLSSDGSSASKGVTITALVRDGNNASISGTQVIFAVNNNGLVNPALTETDADGVAETVLTTGNDPTNRTLTVTATAGNIVASININVVGTTISVTGPTSTQFSSPTSGYSVLLVDASGKGIPGATVTITSAVGNTISASTTTTNASGVVNFSYTATTNSASDTITASALGISSTLRVTISLDAFTITAPAANAEVPLNSPTDVTAAWTRGTTNVAGNVTFSTTRGKFVTTACTEAGSASTTVATSGGVATARICSADAGFASIVANGDDGAGATPTASRDIEFVATTPATIAVQASPSRIAVNQNSEITAIVRDPNGNLVKGQQVTFLIEQDPTGGRIVGSPATTNSQGVAKVTYGATATPSADNGVVIRATVVSNTSINEAVSITVGGQAARITLGTGNEIIDASITLYKLPYTVLVTDNAGNAVSGATVSLKVVPVYYQKGAYGTDPSTPGSTELVPLYTVSAPGCANEDVDFDGFLDAGEDLNANGSLDPGNIASVPASITVGADGTGTFDVTYFKDRGNWVQVRLTASTTVSGNQANTSQQFTLPIAEADADNPPGAVSPYGTASSCADPN